MNTQRKLTVVPLSAATVKSRQQKAMEKIEKAKRKNKHFTYSDPEVRRPVLQMNEVTRRATKEIDATASMSLLDMIWEKLRGR